MSNVIPFRRPSGATKPRPQTPAPSAAAPKPGIRTDVLAKAA
jgi:hypothetical protein